ncbi:hypothetical protein [Methylobacterium sp. 391_Methyba4]|uniref:hypothetical protein n=1 Tax=Methylobacterium sp. 391_Methyba4 TaxID=3038924 RepID=UPI00241F6A44|nr:hypothetical protein [Methylobacterium sp. 391_Methyba4]WFS09599.1 hypothetical protein P9K36_10050 [Methylobacterium sp. 391_Methyba4]
MSDPPQEDRVAATILDLHEALCRDREETRRQLLKIEGEIDRLRTAAKAVRLDLPEPRVTGLLGHSPDESTNPQGVEAQAPPRTIKEAALIVLRTHGRGMSTLEILPHVNNLLGNSYERGSLSPQLSRLVKDKILLRDGDKWMLP